MQCSGRGLIDAQQSPPQLTQSINPNPKVDLPQPQKQPRSFHPGRGEALVPLQGSSAPQEGVQAPEGKGIGGLGIQVPTQHPQTAQPSGLNLAALAGSITGRREAISVVPPAERQGYAAGVPSASGTKAQVGACRKAELRISRTCHRFRYSRRPCTGAKFSRAFALRWSGS